MLSMSLRRLHVTFDHQATNNDYVQLDKNPGRSTISILFPDLYQFLLAMRQGDERVQKRRKLQAMMAAAKANYDEIEKHTRAVIRSSKIIAKSAISRLGQKSGRIFFEAAVLYRLTQCWKTVHDFMEIHAKHYVQLVGDDSTGQASDERVEIAATMQSEGTGIDLVMQNVEDPLHFKLLRFVAERKLFHWLLSVNCKGITPTTCTVVEQYVMMWPDHHRSAQLLDHFSNLINNPRAQESWARSFRSKFLLKYRKLPVQPPLAEDTIKVRVWALNLSILVSLFMHSWTIFGPKRVQTWGRFLAPFLGP
jgi:hypothetical protein